MSTTIEWTQQDSERFDHKVERSEECWNWKSGVDSSGYGKFWIRGRCMKTSRFAFLRTYGFLPVVVRHTCDNRLCVRPDHLLSGTTHENQLDARERGRIPRSQALHDPAPVRKRVDGERNGRAVLTAVQVDEIRRRYASAERTSLRMLAREFHVSKTLIQRIIQRIVWNTTP